MKRTPKKVELDGETWIKGYCDDRSGWWYELKGPFGELVVEPEFDMDTFTVYWWPPRINSGEPVNLGRGQATYEDAMRTGKSYLHHLSQALATG